MCQACHMPDDELVRLITDVKESLERELQGMASSIRQELREGFAQVTTRFDTQGDTVGPPRRLMANRPGAGAVAWMTGLRR